MSKALKFQTFLVILIVGFLVGPKVVDVLRNGGFGGVSDRAEAAKLISQPNDTPAAAAPTKQSANSYTGLGLTAKSVYVWDAQTHRKLYAYNEHVRYPLASVTKMMMALVAVEVLPPTTKITIAPVDLLEEGDTGLRVGEKWALKDLLKFTLVVSSNDGASAIASVAGASLLRNSSSTDPLSNKKMFIQKMNEKARTIGLENTYFNNESGLDIESVTAGAYGSSRDMAMLFEYVYRNHPELFTSTAFSKVDITSDTNIVHHAVNTNATVDSIPGMIGSKTGYTDLAGGNLVVIVDIGLDHPVIFAVLGSTREARFTDIQKLITATVKEITQDPDDTITTP